MLQVVLEMAADRGAFIDQSQSLNIHIAEPNYGKLSSMHFYAWKLVSCHFMYIYLGQYRHVSLVEQCLYVRFLLEAKLFCNIRSQIIY